MKYQTLIIVFFIILCLSISSFISVMNSKVEVERTYLYTSKIVYSNIGDSSLSLNNDSRLFSVFMNTSWQTVNLLSVNKLYAWTKDNDGNQKILLEVLPIPPGGNITLTTSLKIVKQRREQPDIIFSNSWDLSDIPPDLKEEYCVAEGSFLVNDSMLRSLAYNIWSSEEKTENVLSTVTGFANWIGNQIRPVSHEMPYYPNETFITREGDCDDQAVLLVTLCRILGIPAYLQIGCRSDSGIKEGFYYNGHMTTFLRNIRYHGWAMVYVPPWGWLLFDMTLGWSNLNSLDAITRAPIWYLDTIKIMDIEKSDWAGDGRRQKEYIINSQIYIYYEDELIVQDQGDLWMKFVKTFSFRIPVMIILSIIFLFFFKFKTFFNHDKLERKH